MVGGGLGLGGEGGFFGVEIGDFGLETINFAAQSDAVKLVEGGIAAFAFDADFRGVGKAGMGGLRVGQGDRVGQDRGEFLVQIIGVLRETREGEKNHGNIGGD